MGEQEIWGRIVNYWLSDVMQIICHAENRHGLKPEARKCHRPRGTEEQDRTAKWGRFFSKFFLPSLGGGGTS